MRITGTADLPLHEGHAPSWLVRRMKHLASAIVRVIVDDYGEREVLRRLSDPFWFQSFGCVLGFDWHSSGLTTVVTGSLREALSLEEHGVALAGGKGRMSRTVQEQLSSAQLNETTAEKLYRASRLAAKVDNAVLQDGYSIYHHIIAYTSSGEWAVIQQGMNDANGYARRYHWLWEDVGSFVVEPHSGLVGDRVEERVINMTSRESEEARRVSLDIVRESPQKLIRLINLASSKQETLTAFTSSKDEQIKPPAHLVMPRRIDWDAVRRAYDVQPTNYEELVDVRGMGPATIRALALVASIIYGAEVDWRDPVKYSFAHGGKDGVPYPVERRRMDKVIGFLREAVEASEIDAREKKDALQRLLSLERRLYGRG